MGSFLGKADNSTTILWCLIRKFQSTGNECLHENQFLSRRRQIVHGDQLWLMPYCWGSRYGASQCIRDEIGYQDHDHDKALRSHFPSTEGISIPFIIWNKGLTWVWYACCQICIDTMSLGLEPAIPLSPVTQHFLCTSQQRSEASDAWKYIEKNTTAG